MVHFDVLVRASCKSPQIIALDIGPWKFYLTSLTFNFFIYKINNTVYMPYIVFMMVCIYVTFTYLLTENIW